MGGDHNHGSGPLGLVCRKALEQIKPEFAREVHVEEQHVGPVAQQELPSLVDARRLEDLAHLGAKQI